VEGGREEGKTPSLPRRGKPCFRTWSDALSSPESGACIPFIMPRKDGMPRKAGDKVGCLSAGGGAHVGGDMGLDQGTNVGPPGL
jgi:hypothetical protein